MALASGNDKAALMYIGIMYVEDHMLWKIVYYCFVNEEARGAGKGERVTNERGRKREG